MYRKSSCTTPGIGVGVGGDVSNLLKFVHDEQNPDSELFCRGQVMLVPPELLQMSFFR